MDNAALRIFLFGALATALVAGVVIYFKSGERLQGSVLKARTIELNETSSLLLLDVRIENKEDKAMAVDRVGMSIVTADGTEVKGRALAKADLNATFSYYPLLGEKFNPPLGFPDEIPPKTTVDREVAASFDVPVKDLDARTKVTLRVENPGHEAGNISGK
jgi:hypothetical protein